GLPEVLRADDERVRRGGEERPGGGPAEGTGGPVQQPEQEPEQGCHLHSRNLSPCHGCGLRGPRAGTKEIMTPQPPDAPRSAPEPSAVVQLHMGMGPLARAGTRPPVQTAGAGRIFVMDSAASPRGRRAGPFGGARKGRRTMPTVRGELRDML